MAYYIYILQSETDGTYYLGSSQDPEKRLEKHNAPHHGYTGRKQPWKLVYPNSITRKARPFVGKFF